MQTASAEDMRQIERLAAEQGIGYARLMEQAGTAAASWLLREQAPDGQPVVLVCGKGNNGGDGFVMARQLCRIAAVTVILTSGEPVTEQAAQNYARLTEEAVTVLDWREEPYLCSASVREAAVLVDAVYGIGFHGRLPEELRPLLRQMNRCEGYKLAVDVPSGLNADTGMADEDVFRADVTLTFTALKKGLEDASAAGRVQVLSIGIPPEIPEQVLGQSVITETLVRGCFSARDPDSHKGTYGHVLLICGSYGMAGAAMLATRAALRCGAGLVTVAVPRSVYPLMAPGIPEAVFLPLPETPGGQIAPEGLKILLGEMKKATAVVMGCGLGRGETVRQLAAAVLRECSCPLILDADGINAVEPHILLEETTSAPRILTPHPGEMARLLGVPTVQVQAHRPETARQFADRYGVTLVLKGHDTLVASPDKPMLLNETGNPGMATGGSGDVLAGMIGSLAAQGMDAWHAALCGVYLHGAAGDRAAARLSQHSMLPSDLLEELGGLFLNLEK